MSRIAKHPVVVPTGVDVKISPDAIIIKGKHGELSLHQHREVNVALEDNHLVITTTDGSTQANALSGTVRALLHNMVVGVTQGFEKKLQLVGVGYRAQAQGKVLNLSLGFSHPVAYQLPQGITATTPTQTDIVISGADKQAVGQVAAEIRGYRPPEPYKGKGVRYADERVVIKETKKK